MKLMGVDWPGQMQIYRSYGIDTALHYPCSNNSSDYNQRLFVACKHVFNMVNNKNLRVFVHCSSGLIRAPTVVLAYLCMFKRVRNWQNV